jgi:hypothetical protein
MQEGKTNPITTKDFYLSTHNQKEKQRKSMRKSMNRYPELLGKPSANLKTCLCAKLEHEKAMKTNLC